MRPARKTKDSLVARAFRRVKKSLRGSAAEENGDFQTRFNDDGSSLSGHEKNRLFVNRAGATFTDLSGVSGLDHEGDSRSFVIWDYDRDGWQDVGLANANAPLLQLFRNRLGELPEASVDSQMVAVRFRGGNRSAEASNDWSARDGYGATITVELGGMKVFREHRAGDGRAAQNSATQIVGIEAASAVPVLSVRWPSGREQTVSAVPAGSLVTLFENPAESVDGSGFVIEDYAVNATRGTYDLPIEEPKPARLELASGQSSEAKLRLYTTMASWCVPCRAEVPQLRNLSERFSDADLAIYAIPIDPNDGPDVLDEWMESLSPPYELLADLTPEEVEQVSELVFSQLKRDGVPVSFVTDAVGDVLSVQWGPPSVSGIRGALSRGSRPGRENWSRGE